MLALENVVFQVIISKGDKKLSIEIISDTSSVLHLANHVLDDSHGDGQGLVVHRGTRHEVTQIFLDEAKGGLKIGVVVFVGNAPSNTFEFPSLLHDGMEETNGKDQGFPTGMLNLLQKIGTNYRCECLVKPGFDSLWRLIGDFNGSLQKSKWEFGMGFAGDP